MSFNTLPGSLQSIVQEGMLEREFKAPLGAKTGFRDIADKEAFRNGIGETLIKTRAGLLATAASPLALSTNDLNNGIVDKVFPTEQYSLSVAQYGDGTHQNLIGDSVAIQSVFLQNAKVLGEQADRTVDSLARDAAFGNYMGGNTIVRVALGSAGTAVAVDDVRGFAPGQIVSVDGRSGIAITAVAPDASNANASIFKAYGGRSGTLTFATNVAAVAVGKSVMKAEAAFQLEADDLSVDMCLDAATQLKSNGVPTLASGRYRAYVSPKQTRSLYRDTQFKNWMQGNLDSPEARQGIVAVIGGIEFVETNMNPVHSGGTLGIVVGAGALIEAQYTPAAYAEAMSLSNESMTWHDGIIHVVRGPLDRLQQQVSQSWAWIGGYTAPTDITTTPDIMPSASNAALKRAVVLKTKN